MRLLIGFLLGVSVTLTVIVTNIHELYAWHWRTFVYVEEK
jgi:hypothetical protein